MHTQKKKKSFYRLIQSPLYIIMNINKSMKSRMYPGKTLGALLIVLLLMPLGHALMILMEQIGRAHV